MNIYNPPPKINLQVIPYGPDTYNNIWKSLPTDIKSRYNFYDFPNAGKLAGKLFKQGHDVIIIYATSLSRGILVNSNDNDAISEVFSHNPYITFFSNQIS